MEKESKFRYLIYPEYIYSIKYDDGIEIEVYGEAILAHFRREALLQALFDEEEGVTG